MLSLYPPQWIHFIFWMWRLHLLHIYRRVRFGGTEVFLFFLFSSLPHPHPPEAWVVSLGCVQGFCCGWWNTCSLPCVLWQWQPSPQIKQFTLKSVCQSTGDSRDNTESWGKAQIYPTNLTWVRQRPILNPVSFMLVTPGKGFLELPFHVTSQEEDCDWENIA